MRIIVDADACPVVVKKILYKSSKRLNFELILVANQFMRIPESDLITSVIVSEGPDVADDHIVEITNANDLIITADIPLADRVIKKSAVVLDPRGKFLTADNVGQRLAMRNLMEELRSAGTVSGGPDSYNDKDKQEFTNQLDKFLTKNLK